MTPISEAAMVMNRKQRRAAKATSRHRRVEREVAVHEAGHCVGRILVAESLGRSPNEAIFHVEIHPAPIANGTRSIDGTHELRSQATTYGMMISRPMEEFLRSHLPPAKGSIKYEEIKPLIPEMRAASIDVDLWYQAKCIEYILASMAEAKFLEKSFGDVWNSYSSELDAKMLVDYGLLCGMDYKGITVVINQMVAVAEQYVAQPKVWRAILAAADCLRFGTNDGQAIAKIIVRELTIS
jgi:hypothetical protein